MEIIEVCETVSTDYVKDGRIENTSDYIKDAQIIKMSHDLMGSMTEKIASREFREDEYIQCLLDLMTANRQQDEVLNAAMKCSKTLDIQLSLLGTFEFDAPPKPAKIKNANKRTKAKNGKFTSYFLNKIRYLMTLIKCLEPVKAPENVKQMVKDDKGAEKINIVRTEIQKICRSRNTDCLPYFELIINPKSFMASVDAAFQISFLVRDGILGLKRINDVPHIFLYDPDPTSNHTQHRKAENTVQTVMTLTPAMWKEEIEKYGMKAPLLNLCTTTENSQMNVDRSESDDSD
jgi:hypothetical protein